MYRTRIDVERGDSLCYEVVRAVCAVSGDDPTSVDPLIETVDPDALEDLVRSFQRIDRNRENASITFTFHGCRVTVSPHGMLEARSADP